MPSVQGEVGPVELAIEMRDGQSSGVVLVRGELGVHTATRFREAVGHLMAAVGGEPVVDLRTVVVVDDAGAAAVEGLLRHCREFGGRVLTPRDVGRAARHRREAV